MARTKQTARVATGGRRATGGLTGAIAKNTPAPAPLIMQMSPFFVRVLKEIKEICQTYNATSTWESCRKDELVDNNGTHFGALVENFQMKPNMPFVSSDTGMHIASTTILVEFRANYPFSPPRITFKDKIAHPSISSDGRYRYIGKAMEQWTPGVNLVDYVSSVQHELFFAA
eukprot:7314193-Prymnesium_polylepis.1